MDVLVVRLIGAAFVLVGVANLAAPDAALGVFEFELANPSVLNEARANYGGMHLFLGVLFWLWSRTPASVGYALGLACMLCAGLVFGRVVGIVVGDMPNAAVASFGILEALVAAVCGALLIRRNRSAG